MKIHIKLAAAFATLANQGSQIESTASGILAIVKSAGNINEAKFDDLVEQAYEKNGWNPRAGRPTKDAKPLQAAPDTVRTYVTIVRRALRVGMRVGRYDTFTALRTALERKTQLHSVPTARKGRKGRKAGGVIARIPKSLQEDFKGVEIEQPEEFNLSLFHDIPLLYVKLPASQRQLFKAQLEKLVNQYKGRVPELGTAATERKAA